MNGPAVFMSDGLQGCFLGWSRAILKICLPNMLVPNSDESRCVFCCVQTFHVKG